MEKLSGEELQNNKLLLLGKLSASIAHEIRNPLSAIRLNLESIKINSDSLGDDELESVDACLEAVERIHFIIENTLVLSKSQSDEITKVELNEAASDAVELMKSFSKRYNVKIEKNFSPRLMYVNLNKNKLLQIIINLLTNSLEASENGSVVIINTNVDSNNVVLKVSDSGRGMTEEVKSKIFDDFFTTKSVGTGIGLSVCRQLVDEANGTIDIESTPEVGTTVIVKLPSVSN
ncbi:MAG: HAMP domain-containing sensor histidine kinase [Melioribacteraceae bacterium]|nr:HAMP domain-containing histidine kinase [Melioribacteraceae bacterium]MDD3559171.1 HAMP domain-containing sensor histidine kinase [Melioribacteraceae bacterium]